jgi:REP element-mobilizing transposase RayT
MPNHVHLILKINYQIKSVTLGNIIRYFKARTVSDWLKLIELNQLNALASIWQRNYYEHLIRNEAEYLKFINYVKANPLNWQRDSYHPNNLKNFTSENNL